MTAFEHVTASVRRLKTLIEFVYAPDVVDASSLSTLADKLDEASEAVNGFFEVDEVYELVASGVAAWSASVRSGASKDAWPFDADLEEQWSDLKTDAKARRAAAADRQRETLKRSRDGNGGANSPALKAEVDAPSGGAKKQKKSCFHCDGDHNAHDCP